jgi:hypothetical protein
MSSAISVFTLQKSNTVLRDGCVKSNSKQRHFLCSPSKYLFLLQREEAVNYNDNIYIVFLYTGNSGSKNGPKEFGKVQPSPGVVMAARK